MTIDEAIAQLQTIKERCGNVKLRVLLFEDDNHRVVDVDRIMPQTEKNQWHAEIWL
jgi:hypothetical protein